MTILELTLQKLSSAQLLSLLLLSSNSLFLCASQVSLGALNWSPRMHSLKKKTLLRKKKKWPRTSHLPWLRDSPKGKGKKMLFAYWRGKNEDWHVNCLWHLASDFLFLQQWRGCCCAAEEASPRIFYLVEAVAGLINKKEKREKKNVGYSDMYWNSFGNT